MRSPGLFGKSGRPRRLLLLRVAAEASLGSAIPRRRDSTWANKCGGMAILPRLPVHLRGREGVDDGAFTLAGARAQESVFNCWRLLVNMSLSRCAPRRLSLWAAAGIFESLPWRVLAAGFFPQEARARLHLASPPAGAGAQLSFSRGRVLYPASLSPSRAT